MNKNKVGRPKLADAKTKKESIYVCIYIFAILSIVIFLGFKTILIDFNPKYLVGTIYNDHVTSCIIDKKNIDCGPKVEYIKYSVDDSDYKETTKESSSIEIKLNNYKKLNFCYKTSDEKLNCVKQK